MNINVRCLPESEWKGYELVFRYEARGYYKAEILQNNNGFIASFAKEPFAVPVVKEFNARLFADYWNGAQAFGVFDEARDMEHLIACIELWKEEWSNRMRITELWVAEKYRRRGIGKDLMALAKNKAREMGCRAIILETQSCNENAIAFYMSQGLGFFGFDRSCYSNSDVESNEVRIEMGMYLAE